MMHVAVLVAARNMAALVEDAIGSVLGQSHGRFSLILVDDGSADGTDRLMGAYRDPRVRFHASGGLGVSRARNVAAAMMPAEAEAMLFLDADDWLAPDALARLVARLVTAPRAVAAHGAFRFVPEAAAPASPPPGRTRRVAEEGDLLGRLCRGNLFANGGHVLIRRADWAASGGFRSDLSFGEDWEFWTRLALRGGFVRADGPPLLYVRRRADGAMGRHAADPAAYRAAAAAILDNPTLRVRLGEAACARLEREQAAEIAWTVGRQLLGRGRGAAALPMLRQGLNGRWRLRRQVLVAAVAARVAVRG